MTKGDDGGVAAMEAADEEKRGECARCMCEK
jgi:hypothetical protein